MVTARFEPLAEEFRQHLERLKQGMPAGEETAPVTRDTCPDKAELRRKAALIDKLNALRQGGKIRVYKDPDTGERSYRFPEQMLHDALGDWEKLLKTTLHFEKETRGVPGYANVFIPVNVLRPIQVAEAEEEAAPNFSGGERPAGLPAPQVALSSFLRQRGYPVMTDVKTLLQQTRESEPLVIDLRRKAPQTAYEMEAVGVTLEPHEAHAYSRAALLELKDAYEAMQLLSNQELGRPHALTQTARRA